MHLYGAQTARAVQNFQVSGEGLGRELTGALGQIKLAAATVNRELGLLEPTHCRGHNPGGHRSGRRDP